MWGMVLAILAVLFAAVLGVIVGCILCLAWLSGETKRMR